MAHFSSIGEEFHLLRDLRETREIMVFVGCRLSVNIIGPKTIKQLIKLRRQILLFSRILCASMYLIL